MTNDIELKNSFEEYALNELVKKLHELDPEDYHNYGDKLDSAGLFELLLEDEHVNGCYYIYTKDNEKVFKEYFNDVLRICDRVEHDSDVRTNLNASNLLMVAIEHSFGVLLLSHIEHAVEILGLKFDRAGLDTIATILLDTQANKIEDLIYR